MSDAKAAKAAAKVLRQSNNEWSNKYFAIAMGSIMVLFAIHHWLEVMEIRGFPRQKSFLARKIRLIRGLFSGSYKGLHIGRSALYTIYWAVNLILALTNVDLTNMNYVAKRFGWIAVANLVLLVFLALKNTPLAPLTAKSYEKLRPLHKVAGYTCIFTSCLHGIVYLAAWADSGELDSMQEVKNFAGAIAGLAMVLIGLSTITYLMRGYYELFYMFHIILFILIMITVGMHRPKFSSSTVIIVIFTACLWVSDRLIRTAKICWNFFGNSASITALPDNAIRVRLNRRINSTPGSHAFLWVPAIRWFESHPFTLLSSNPSEFVIRVYDGFTRDLYNAAQTSPGRVFRCSVDGPYGQVPNFQRFDKVILVSGGSGASFTFAIALDLIEKSDTTVKTIDFIWAVRQQENLSWYSQELKRLQNHPSVNLFIYVTRQSTSDSSGTSSLNIQDLSEKSPAETTGAPMESSTSESEVRDIEKGGPQYMNSDDEFSPDKICSGRPDLNSLIAGSVATVSNKSSDDRIIVGVCGPIAMTNATRQAVSSIARQDGPSITQYTEEFEW
ncbi:unnamed protein product [Penicillium manginii]